ncbi:Werner syndrome ATP-dependent helicase-like protein [Armadillidium vulgare]|nr:Werner syndrome ATP-dependent helicase-like protein [Armadillidium vulgare]
MLLNFMFKPNLVKISHNFGSLGINRGIRRKFSQQIWKEKMSDIIQTEGSIILIENELNWEKVSSILTRDIGAVNAVGFDCEWARENGRRKPVSLLQLATYSGNCFLFRLNSFKNNIPPSLQEILENRKILKVGVACDFDASHFAEDYNVKGWLDLRHLAVKDDLKNCKLGLKSLAKHYLGKTLLNNWRLRASDWETNTLTQDQVTYAAEDAIVGISILLAQLKNLWTPVIEERWETSVCKAIEEVCEPFVEVEFNNEKMKFCFVCGNNEVSIRKNVIPQEYKKYFPPLPELNRDRFFVLLCNQCYESNRIQENNLRQKLAEECDAPVGDIADAEEVDKSLKAANAAITLKENKYHLTLKRLILLEDILKDYFETNKLTDDLINQAADMHKEILSKKYNLHSYKVCKHYEDIGLIHLVSRWRQWFLDSMKPKYLPEYFPISHDDECLHIKAKISQYPLDSEVVRDFYKLILVGRDGDLDIPYQPDIKRRNLAASGSEPDEENHWRENELNYSSTEQSVSQNNHKVNKL